MRRSGTWLRLVRRHPQLQRLYWVAKRVADPGYGSFCGYRVWELVFEQAVAELVGSHTMADQLDYVQADFEGLLRLTAAEYDVVREVIAGVLPECRGCHNCSFTARKAMT